MGAMNNPITKLPNGDFKVEHKAHLLTPEEVEQNRSKAYLKFPKLKGKKK